MKKINVVLDVMALGAGYKSNKGRTGVFRVVENLLNGLRNSDECDLKLVSTQFQNESKLFLKENIETRNRLSYPSTADRVINKLNNFSRDFFKNQNIDNFFNAILPDNNLKKLSYKSDVYHSPYMPLPHEIQSSSKIKKILTVHDLIPVILPQYFENNHDSLVKHAIESLGSDGWAICVSQSTKNDLCNYFSFDPNRVFVAHLAASKTLFYPNKDLEKVTDLRLKYKIGEHPYFLSVCTLEPRKNITHVINCFISLIKSKELKDVNLVLAGTKGWDFSTIFESLKDSEIEKRIIFTGFVDDQDLAPLYSDSIGFVYVSHYEGFGLPVLEAMQCGKPVITSNTSSLPEVVENGGILISPTDGDALRQAILDLYHKEDLRKDLSNKALLQSKKFTWENFTSQNISAYKTSLNS